MRLMDEKEIGWSCIFVQVKDCLVHDALIPIFDMVVYGNSYCIM